ncbi:MAG: GntR family transcriptional regulator [Chloroflexi bacterium]|nr:GntR family transcriptional regulator [Chloroflexota bacterium]
MTTVPTFAATLRDIGRIEAEPIPFSAPDPNQERRGQERRGPGGEVPPRDVGERSPRAGPALDLSNLSQRVYDFIKASILKRELAPGQPLVIAELARQFGTSTTPVRDALKRLEIDGLAVIAPRRGCSVAVLTERDIHDLMEIRAIVEGAAAEMTAASASVAQVEQMTGLLRQLEDLTEGERFTDYVAAVELDFQLHLAIVRALDNARLVDFFSKLRVHRRMAPELYDSDYQRAQLDLEEHRKIVEAYRGRDPVAAKRAIVEHLERVKLDALAHLARPEKLPAGVHPDGIREARRKEASEVTLGHS